MSRIPTDKAIDTPACWLRMALAGLLAVFLLAGCGGTRQPAQIDSATSDLEGRARVESAAGVVEFTVISGLTGERQPGVRVSVAVDGAQRMFYAEDPTGTHLPVAAPLDGDATVRRLILPPETGRGFNLATASGALDLEALTALGALSEEGIRQRLSASGDEAVLIYLYNPARPLALTGAPLEAFSTPFPGVTVLRAAGEPPDAALGMVIAGIGEGAYD
ncbi:MAG: hypothetical protein IT326_05195, partial [Anaerolineae bacterium]|nr:hypothetical protein [Anaerolineae bacterium]